MSAKIAEARKAAFLQFLEATGNVTIAAERAKVSRSWVQLHRTENATFDFACRDAAAAARRRLRQADAMLPPEGWGYLDDGCELVVRGTGGSGGGKRVQIARARLHQITPRIEDRFLQVLEATCNVDAACSAVGMTASPFYAHRERWPAFARRWDEAERAGSLRLEIGVMEHGSNLFSASDLPPSIEAPPTSLDEKIHQASMHAWKVHGIGRRPGRERQEMDPDEAIETVLRAIDRVERGMALDEGQKARDREAWAARRGSGGSGRIADGRSGRRRLG